MGRGFQENLLSFSCKGNHMRGKPILRRCFVNGESAHEVDKIYRALSSFMFHKSASWHSHTVRLLRTAFAWPLKRPIRGIFSLFFIRFYSAQVFFVCNVQVNDLIDPTRNRLKMKKSYGMKIFYSTQKR